MELCFNSSQDDAVVLHKPSGNAHEVGLFTDLVIPFFRSAILVKFRGENNYTVLLSVVGGKGGLARK